MRHDEKNTMVLEVGLCGYFWQSYEQTKNDLWVIDMSSEVTGSPDTLNLGTNRCVS